MEAPNPKRHHHGVSSSNQNPKSGFLQNQVDLIISTLLSFSDTTTSSLLSPVSISSSFDRVLDKTLASVSSDVSVQNRIIDHTLKLTSLLHESTKRCFLKRASLHNSNSWLLPQELTIKVFSNLDTKSLMQVMVCCKMFQNCALNPISYSRINLTTSAKNVDDGTVCTMIQRAGKELRYLEVGHVARQPKSTTPLLTGSCLVPLSYNNGFIGKNLRSIHLYDVRYLKDKTSIATLSACSNITDLKIVGLYSPSEQLIKSLTLNCRFIEHLFLETYGFPGSSRKQSSVLVDFFTNIPNLTSLTLIGFRISDESVQRLSQVDHKIKYMNISRNPSFSGSFLRDLGHSLKDSALETLILRDCASLEEKEVLQFIYSLLARNFRFIKHIDVSNNIGLVSTSGKRSYKPDFPLWKLKEERPDVKIVANFKTLLSRSEKLSRGILSPDPDAEDILDQSVELLDVHNAASNRHIYYA